MTLSPSESDWWDEDLADEWDRTELARCSGEGANRAGLGGPSCVVVAKVGGDERHLLEATLEQSGFTVVPAGDGVEALEMVCAVGPDAIIADLDGRDLDGVVLCRVLRGLRAHARLPVLVLTSARGSTDRARTLRGLGGVWVIRKPVGSAEIAGALSQMLSMVGAPATPSPARRTASP